MSTSSPDRVRGHPLDNEDVRVQIRLTHVPTGYVVLLAETAKADEPPTVSEVADSLISKAKDDLMLLIEISG